MTVRRENLLPLVAQIQADPESDASLQALAERVGLSPAHLQRVFSKMIGESPKRIALRITLERAAAALITSEDSILAIALASGFDSHEGFTRAFRRHFGMAPARYRDRGFAGAVTGAGELALRHREVVEHTAPCVGLYRATSSSTRRRPTMSYTFEKKTLTETPILFMRRRVEHGQIAEVLAELLPGVYGFATREGIPFAGPPLCRYSEWSAGHVTLEAGMPVAAPAEGEGDVLAGTLPAGPAVSTVHKGGYERLPEAHAALEAWMEEKGLRAAGAPWELYVTDPGEVPDPAEWLTEIVYPTRD